VTRILFLRESNERILDVLGSLYVVPIAWALLRLTDNFVRLLFERAASSLSAPYGGSWSTFDNAVIFLPNAYLAGVDVPNWSRRKLGRRIKFTLRLEYGSDMAQVKKTVDDIRAMLIAHEGIAEATTDISGSTQQQLAKIADTMDGQGIKRTLLVYLDALGDNSIDILSYCFSKTCDWQGWLEAKQDVLFRCCAIVGANGRSMAFPNQTLYLREDSGQKACENDRKSPSIAS
jgi:small-conductance mechanosensitive channel